MRTHLCIFESRQLEGLCVGDLLYVENFLKKRAGLLLRSAWALKSLQERRCGKKAVSAGNPEGSGGPCPWLAAAPSALLQGLLL